MKLSPLDVRHMEFERGALGYRQRAVREFLERLADEIEDVLRELQGLRQAVAERDARIEDLRATEAELKRAVVAAERIGNEIKEQARSEAAAMTRHARRERVHVLQETTAELEAARSELVRLEQTQALVREQLRGHLTGFLTALDARPGSRIDTTPAADVIASLRNAVAEARAELKADEETTGEENSGEENSGEENEVQAEPGGSDASDT